MIYEEETIFEVESRVSYIGNHCDCSPNFLYVTDNRCGFWSVYCITQPDENIRRWRSSGSRWLCCDINQFTDNRTVALDTAWAQTRAVDHFNWAIENYEDEDSWMKLTLTDVSVSGNDVYATVVGRCEGLIVKAFGISEWRTVVTSHAKVSAGITSDIAPR